MVGKTCMLIAYTEERFPQNYEPTVFENYSEMKNFEGITYNLKLWDTAGQEDYERLRPLSYPDTKCFLICFAINSRTSYDNVATKWAPEVRYHMANTPILLVGTKADLREDPNEDLVSEKAGNKLKKKIKAESYLECSAKNMTGLDEIFEEALRLGSRAKTRKPGTKSPSCLLF